MFKKSLFCAVLFSALLTSDALVFAAGPSGSKDAEREDSSVPHAGRLPLEEKLKKRALDFNNPRQFRALTTLWDSDRNSRADIRPILLELAQSHEHPHQMSAVTILWNSDEDQEAENRLLLVPSLMKIAQTLDSPHRLDVATKLWHSRGAQRQNNRLFARGILTEIAFDQTMPARQRQDALFCLGESAHPVDQFVVQVVPAPRPEQRKTRMKLNF